MRGIEAIQKLRHLPRIIEEGAIAHDEVFEPGSPPQGVRLLAGDACRPPEFLATLEVENRDLSIQLDFHIALFYDVFNRFAAAPAGASRRSFKLPATEDVGAEEPQQAGGPDATDYFIQLNVEVRAEPPRHQPVNGVPADLFIDVLRVADHRVVRYAETVGDLLAAQSLNVPTRYTSLGL